ncbi:DUF4830 domain-containing protein [Evansella cellulosilytica]|uniref:Uncharacterized protein n=1 Tax=Evansella cellulosilytica (strain ATCC 21833 / DSM 2522 / FERM P-1141 / JCM 9156 / N-4) TaxID=649639 RepID=E6U1G2_EVAC2|nr:DUF4830 domain-containing protein [Evansella cellulosilytica]ADU29209.1 hypothetical protein Bcell_0933 [Evansella cellulosilytica DSM 2522]
MKYFYFFFILIVSGCSLIQLSDSADIAKEHLEDKGYRVISLVNESSGELTSSWVEGFPGSQEWDVQNVDPDEYIGKEIKRVRFKVKNHPLNSVDNDEVNVTVFLHEEEVIGGISFFVNMDGAPYSLDGN